MEELHRFFLAPELFTTNEIHLPADISRQIERVLRLRVGETITLLNNQAVEFQAILTEVNDRKSVAVVVQKAPTAGEPRIKLTMLVSLTQREKLQKCTEIGVSSFVPFTSSRSLVQKPEEVEAKYPRWRKIIQEAAEQSRRGRIPELLPAVRLREILIKQQLNDSLKIALWEDEIKTTLKQTLFGFQGEKITVAIGPEGGFSEEELRECTRMGFVSASLGKRILRMETSAIVAAGLVLYELG
jgi:16S rRNA (uracil1498-N3)-methyltransferase